MKLLVAVEASDHADAAIAAASKLAREAQAEVLLLNIVNPMTDAADIVADSRDEAVRQLVGERKAILEPYIGAFEPPATVRVEELNHGEATAEGIARVANEHGTDILVIATSRANRVRGVLLGSVAQDLIRLHPCPILVVSKG